MRRLIFSLCVTAVLAGACVAPDDRSEEAARLTGADPEEGRVLVDRLGCGACHSISGVPGARGTIGPRLDGMRERRFVAGVLPHDLGNLVAFIVDPRATDRESGMPDLGVSEADALRIASFLYSLEP